MHCSIMTLYQYKTYIFKCKAFVESPRTWQITLKATKLKGYFFITNLCLNQLNAGILGKTEMKEYDILL